jgi:copper chaperone
MKHQTILIDGMSCNHCVMSVRKNLAQVDGLTVDDVTIGSATVEYDEAQVDEALIREAIRNAGFTPKN